MAKKGNYSKAKEIVAYSISGFFWVAGLVLSILGFYAFNGTEKLANNPIFQAEKQLASFLGMSGTLDFRIVGSIICLIAMCFLLGFIYHFASKADKVSSRKARQLARLKELIEQDEKEKQNIENSETQPAQTL